MRIAPAQPLDVAAQLSVLGLTPDGPAVAPDLIDPSTPAPKAATAATDASSAGGYGADGRSGSRRGGALVDLLA